MLLASVVSFAQKIDLERYTSVPEEYDRVFIDHCKTMASGVATSPLGQYFGQITPDRSLYGFGTFYTDRDGVITGQFRDAYFLFGIKMGVTTALVGSNEHYTCYDLTSGDPLYVVKDSVKYDLSDDFINKYKFVSLTYQNGDKYVGEVVDGKRDGLGIYYYVNGNYYYGKYRNNVRSGAGAMFKTDNTITINFWSKSENE